MKYYDAELNIDTLVHDIDFVNKWFYAQMEHIAPAQGAVVTSVSHQDDPENPRRAIYRVGGYYRDDNP